MIGLLCNELCIGGAFAQGQVQGVTVRESQTGAFTVEWGVLPDYDDDALRNLSLLLYVNSRLMQRLPGNATATVFLAAPGAAHDVQVIAWRADIAPPDSIHGAVLPTRVHLAWARSTDETLSAYLIYRSATGSAPWTLHATHSRRGVQTGRTTLASGAQVIVAGQYDGQQYSNTVVTVTVTDVALGMATVSTGGIIQFTVGRPCTILGGVTVTFLSAPAVDDALDILFGIQPEYDTGVLTAGTYYFCVAAVDGAGNEGTKSAAVMATLGASAEPLEDVALSVDEDGILHLTGSAPEGTTAVDIYSNRDGDAVLPYVIYDAPGWTFAQDAGPVDIEVIDTADLPDGDYVFVARASNGTNDDGTAVPLRITLPYVAPELATPVRIASESVAGGDCVLTWLASDDPPGGWQLKRGGSTLTVTPTATEASGSNPFAYEATAPYSLFGSADGTYTVEIRARSASGAKLGLPGSVSCVADSTAPGQVNGLTAVVF